MGGGGYPLWRGCRRAGAAVRPRNPAIELEAGKIFHTLLLPKIPMKNFSHPASAQNPYEKFFLLRNTLLENFSSLKKHFDLQGKKKNF